MAKIFPDRIKQTRNSTTAAKPPGSVIALAASTPNLDEEIRSRAYELYEAEGRQGGRDQEYWFRAEAEVRRRRGLRSA